MTAERGREFDTLRQGLRSSVRESLKINVPGTTIKNSPRRFQQAVGEGLKGFIGRHPEVEDYRRQLLAGAMLVQHEANIEGGQEFPDLLKRAMKATLEDMQGQYSPEFLKGDSQQTLRIRNVLLGARLFVDFVTSVSVNGTH